MASLDGGASWQPVGTSAAPAVIGQAATILADGSSALFDAAASVEVELLHDGMALEGRGDDALVGGANIVMLGDELIQFGAAEPLTANRWRLSRLLRGRRGSEWAMAEHAIGERFVLIESAALLPFDLPGAALGANVRIMASGVGDAIAAEAEILAQGRALRPPAPVHLTARRLADGAIRFSWTRRSRAGWAWLDGGDAPLAEESERYALSITPDVGATRSVETTAVGQDYAVAEQIADGASAATMFTISLHQLGSIGASLSAATASFTL